MKRESTQGLELFAPIFCHFRFESYSGSCKLNRGCADIGAKLRRQTNLEKLYMQIDRQTNVDRQIDSMTYIRICMYMYMYICIYVDMYMNILVWVCGYIYICSRQVFMHVCMLVYLYVNTYTCICICIFMVCMCMCTTLMTEHRPLP